MSRSLLMLLVVATLAVASASHPFTECDGAVGNLGITAVTLTPDQPAKGQNLTVAVAFTPKVDLTPTLNLHLNIAVGPIPITTKNFYDRNKHTKAVPTAIDIKYLIPTVAVPGMTLNVEMDASEVKPGDKDVDCVKLNVVIAGASPMSMAVLTPPEETVDFLWTALQKSRKLAGKEVLLGAEKKESFAQDLAMYVAGNTNALDAWN